MKPSGEAERSMDQLLRQPTVQAAALFPSAEFLPDCVLLYFGRNSA